MKLTEQNAGKRTVNGRQRVREQATKQLQRWKTYWQQEWSDVSHARLYAATMVAGLALIGSSYLAINRIQTTGDWVRLYSNGHYVGLVPNNQDVLDGVRRTANAYHVNFQHAPVHMHVSPDYNWQVAASLPTAAVAIRYNGHDLVYTATRAEARTVLNHVKQALTPKGLSAKASVSFVGSVAMADTTVGVSSIMDPTSAVHYLLSAQTNPASSMEASSKLAGRSESLLRAAEAGKKTASADGVKSSAQTSTPSSRITTAKAATQSPVNLDTGSTGDGLGGSGSSTNLLIQVEVKETVTKLVSLPYPVHYVKDNHLGKGTVKVTTKGQPGKEREEVLVTYVNGKSVSTKVLQKTVIDPPKPEVADKGTNPEIATGTWGWPTAGYIITSPFGWRNLDGRPNFHPGIDIGVPIGTPVYATNNGVVESAGWNSGGYGNWVKINNGNGIETVFGHLSKVLVRAGQVVAKGEEIGLSGDTGFSTGPHLHYEVRKYGTAVNPVPYMNH